MQRNFLSLVAIVACVSLFNLGCNKLDSTTLGEELIPAVDNVSTFADTLVINAAREQNVDSTRLYLTETHVLGSINNDPIFGKTRADLFLQFKPSFFPYYFGKSKDTINSAQNNSTHFDSAYICLAFTAFYGDSTKPQHFKVYKLDENTSNFADTIAHDLHFTPTPYPTNLIGAATIYQPALKNFGYLGTSLKDSVVNQIRIKLDPSFLTEFVNGDSSATGIGTNPNHSFNNDSLFKEKYKGFAIVADGDNAANGLFYVSLTDPATRLEIFYTATNNGKLDTAFASFPVSSGTSVSASATANYIKRDTLPSEFASSPDPNALYILSAPGTAINLKIPKLDAFANRIIHRAEIFLEQVPGTAGNDVLPPPSYLYLDLADDTTTANTIKYKPLYYDLNPNDFYQPDNISTFFPASGIDYSYYGGYLRNSTGGSTGNRSYYTFNVTRYVQNLATKGGINYKMRVSAPYNLTYNGLNFQYQNRLAAGRVKIYNGQDPNYRIRMRIVWSKI